jgi:hypothetical protein
LYTIVRGQALLSRLTTRAAMERCAASSSWWGWVWQRSWDWASLGHTPAPRTCVSTCRSTRRTSQAAARNISRPAGAQHVVCGDDRVWGRMAWINRVSGAVDTPCQPRRAAVVLRHANAHTDGVHPLLLTSLVRHRSYNRCKNVLDKAGESAVSSPPELNMPLVGLGTASGCAQGRWCNSIAAPQL